MTETAGIRLVVGLGNPGDEYAGNRHNAGAWFADRLARRHGGVFKSRGKLLGSSCRIEAGSRALWLFKPSTFMNDSGRALRAFADFYKIETRNMLVAHDEIDFEVAKTRLKRGGGHGRHNGLVDVIRHLDADFWRLRVGVGHPGDRDKVVRHVLSDPGGDDTAAIMAAIERACDVVERLAEGDFDAAMTALHTD